MLRRAKSKIRGRGRRDANEQASPATRLAIRVARWDEQGLLLRRLPARHRQRRPTERASAPRKRYSGVAPTLRVPPCTTPSAAVNIESTAKWNQSSQGTGSHSRE